MAAAKFLILVLGVLFLTTTTTLVTFVYGGVFPTTLVLERVDSAAVTFGELKTRDRIRHVHMFFQSSSMRGVVNFPLQGSSDSFTFGRYFTRVKLGNPAREYCLMIDTGSDVTWINCASCAGCPRTSQLIELSFFDPRSSYSAEPISCSGHICKSVAQARGCSSNSLCTYSLPYADGSSAAGYYMSDMLHLDTIAGNSLVTSSSEIIVFGCTNNESGRVTNPKRALDGIFGLGHQPISVISQLGSREVAPKVFSHCMKGGEKGGGVLVLGEIVEPGIVYSPLVLSQLHYHLNLLSISINGQTVPIDPKVFATSSIRGTIVDSGTTLAFLAEEAYGPFITALDAAVAPSVNSFPSEGNHCFQVSSSASIRDVFPIVSLNFAGGASMLSKPEEYLLPHFDAVPGAWCVGFQKNQLQISPGLTILGDLVLQDKIIVYDLARQRLGWTNYYDCSSSMNVTSVPPKVSSSSRDAVLDPIATTGFIVFIFMLLVLL